MNKLNCSLVAILLFSLLGLMASPVLAQDQVVSDEPGVVEAEPVERTNTDRLLDIKQTLEQNRLKLAKLDQEQEVWRQSVESLGEEIENITGQLEETRTKLEELGPEGDPAEKVGLQNLASKFESLLVILKTEAELALTGESTVGEQKLALEKYIEREDRVRAQIRGEKPAITVQAPDVVSPGTPPAPSGGTALPYLIPGMPAGPAATVPAKIEARLETPEQIRALRELERLELQLAEAEQDVVEFVKRRESLDNVILIEDRLLQTARQSRENLEKARNWCEDVLEQSEDGGSRQWQGQDLRKSEKRISGMIDLTTANIEEHTASLAILNNRLDLADPEELQVTQKVEAARLAVKKAKDQLFWLQSPLHPRNLLQWARTRGPRMLLVLVVAGVLLLLLRLTVRRATRLVVRKGRDAHTKGTNRADTLAFSFRSAFSVIVLIGGFLLVLQEAGLDIKTVLGGAAILGVAIAFGAQNLMRDYFTGFLILLEDQYVLGDLITIGSVTGTVESVNMRVTVLRDLEGRVHFIPNGEIKGVTNRTYGWGRAVLEVPVGFDQDVDQAMEVLQGVSKELRTDPVFGEWIEEEPVMLGVDKFTEYGVVIKFMLKTQPDKVFPIRRELLRRIKKKFDQVGIVISVPHRVIMQQKPED
jgi:small-conductance mechanosensitive channel